MKLPTHYQKIGVPILVCLLLLFDFTTLFNILGHQRHFRHRVWKVWQILLRGSNFGLRFFYVRRNTSWLQSDTASLSVVGFIRNWCHLKEKLKNFSTYLIDTQCVLHVSRCRHQGDIPTHAHWYRTYLDPQPQNIKRIFLIVDFCK